MGLLHSAVLAGVLAAVLPGGDAFFWGARTNVFNSEEALTVAPGEYVPNCHGRPCEAVAVPEDPRTQRVIVIMESYCPALYDEELETYCNNPTTSFGDPKKCFSGKLPYQDRRAEGHRGVYKSAYTAMFRRVAPLMPELGWTDFGVTSFNSTRSWTKLKKSNIIICNLYHFRILVQRFPEKRYIVINSNDAGTVTTATGCDLDDPRVLAIWQHTTILPLAENNGPLVESRRHFSWLTDVQESDTNYIFRAPKFTASALSKIDVMIPQIYRWRYPLDCGGRRGFTLLQPAFHLPVEQWVKPFGQRKYDITFIGTITKAGSRQGGGVNDHRKDAIHAIQRLKAKYPNLSVFTQDTTVTYEQFVSIMRDTKVFISPYGLGEFSGKDYEAMLTGCLLVKPWAHKLRAYPNIYGAEYSLDVDLDFSNLESVMMPYFKDAMENGEYAMATERAYAQIALLKKHAETSQFAADLDAAMLPLVSRSVAYDIHQCRKPPSWHFDAVGNPAAPGQRQQMANHFESQFLSIETDPWGYP